MIKREVEGLVTAGESFGLVTRTSALTFLTRSQLKTRVRTGAWVRVLPELFRVVGAPVTWRQNLEGLLTWAGRGAVLSHRTAACLHGFPNFPEGPLDLTCTRRLRPQKDVSLYREKVWLDSELDEIDDLAVTSVTRTLIDLAARTDGQTLRAVFDQALREKKTTLKKLATAVARSKNRPGVIDVRTLLRELEGAGGPTESELEERSVNLIVDSGLPRPTVQWKTVVGRKQRRLDLLFKEQCVVIETDGYAFHSGIDTFEADRQRNNSLALEGYLVLHWTWLGLNERPEELIAELYAALNSWR